MQETTQQNTGLLPLPKDQRDYSHSKVFGTLGAPQIPNVDFTVADKFYYTIQYGDTLSTISIKFGTTVTDIMNANVGEIKDKNKIRSGQVITIPMREIMILNQEDLDFCTGFSSTTLDYYLHGVSFDPLYRFAKTKQIRGEYQVWGANLRDAMQAAVKFGSLPAVNAPFKRADKTRDFLANWNNYPKALDAIAVKFRDGSFFKVDGSGDAFDNIRSTLWINRQYRRGVNFGLFWRPEWGLAKNGVVEDSNYLYPEGQGHAVDLIGQKIINGVPYIILQNSWGPDVGQHGLYYFPRSIINKEAAVGFGMFTLSKLSGTRASRYTAYNISINDSFITKGFKILFGFFTNIFSKS